MNASPYGTSNVLMKCWVVKREGVSDNPFMRRNGNPVTRVPGHETDRVTCGVMRKIVKTEQRCTTGQRRHVKKIPMLHELSIRFTDYADCYCL